MEKQKHNYDEYEFTSFHLIEMIKKFIFKFFQS